MNEKFKDLYKQAEALANLSFEVRNLAKTISYSMNYSVGISEPFFYLTSVAKIMDQKAAKLSDSCDELSDKILLEWQEG